VELSLRDLNRIPVYNGRVRFASLCISVGRFVDFFGREFGPHGKTVPGNIQDGAIKPLLEFGGFLQQALLRPVEPGNVQQNGGERPRNDPRADVRPEKRADSRHRRHEHR